MNAVAIVLVVLLALWVIWAMFFAPDGDQPIPSVDGRELAKALDSMTSAYDDAYPVYTEAEVFDSLPIEIQAGLKPCPVVEMDSNDPLTFPTGAPDVGHGTRCACFDCFRGRSNRSIIDSIEVVAFGQAKPVRYWPTQYVRGELDTDR